MDNEVLYQYGHMHKRDAYNNPDIGAGVIANLDKLDLAHLLGKTETAKIRKSRDLTGQGKVQAVRKLAKELYSSLDDLVKVDAGYQDQIRQIEESIKPYRHPRDDVAFMIESREIRDHIRSLDPAEQEGFVLAALEQDNDHVLQAVLYAPIPFRFASEKMIEKIQTQRSERQFPDEAAKLADLRLASQETASAIGSVKAELAKQGIDLTRVDHSDSQAA